MKESKHTNFHPSAMDAMMQTVATMGTTHDGFSVPHLPKMLGSVVINGSIQQSMYGYSHMIKHDEEGFHFNCLLLCPNGRIIAEIRNYYYQKMNLDLPSPMNVSFNEVKWCLTKTTIPKYSFGDQNQETAQVAFLCTKRFAESMSEVNKKIADVNVLSEASSENKELLDKWLSKPSLKTIVYAPCQHIEERGQLGCEIIEITKGSCLTLQYLLQYIENSHLSVTVYVITESVWSTSFVYQETSNIFGSELWGMVRSAMLELPNIELRLVDMDLCKKNMDALQGILHDGQNKIKEFLLRDGKVFHCQVSEYNNENDIQPRIDIMFDGTDEVVLKSKNPAVIKMPYFEILRRDKKPRLTSNCQLMLNDVCLHDPSLYPITSEFLNTDESVWPEDSETGFKVMCLEGSGFKISSHDQDNRKPRIGFCFPLEVTSIVSVPKECMFEIDEIPCYLPGMVTVGLILWDIVQNIDTSKNTCVVVNEDSNIWVQLVKHLLSLRNLTRLFILKKEDIWLSNYTDLENIILLSAITHNQMKDIIAKCPSIKSIITTENYMSIHVKVWLEQNVKGIDVVILNVEKILDPHTLRHTVFPVCNALRTFNKKLSISEITHEQEERSSNTDMLNLPFHVLSISAQNKVKKRIPLKVDSCSLFRKTGCYIVVGGLTGLGWELVQYMAELGAGYIATFSRRKAPKEKEDQIKVTQMKESCRIIEIQVDITCIKSLQIAVKMLQEQIGSATIRGVFHGGAVLNDKLLKQMSEKDIEDPLLPKVLGTWNLHVATQDCPLDFFVMHSSIAAVFGSHGQCNYAAGNSFEDSFAHYRRQLGLCGQSVNWGALSVGMALSDTKFETYWKSLGFYVLTKEDIRRCFLKIIMGNYVQIVCGKFDWVKLNEGQMVALQPQKYDSFVEKFSGNANKTQTQEHNFCFDEFSRHDEQGKYKMVYDLTKSLLTEVIVTERTTLQEDTTFLSVGVDSMSAMSLINMLYDLVHVRIPLENLLKGSSCLKSLTTYIIQNITCKTSISANLGEQNEYPLYVKFEEFLADEITFMQRYILEKLAGGTNEAHYIVQVAFEIQGVEIPTEYFRSTVKAVCRRHQELRRIYIKKDDELYTTKVLRGEEIAVDVKEIDNIDFEADIRECVHFDLAKDLPVKFMIAAKNGTTRVLAFCHAITFDMATMEPFFKELGVCLQSRNLEEPVRFAAHTESVAEVLSNAILPKATELWQYWNRQMNQDVRPLTLGQTLTENLTEKKMRQILVNVPSALLERINSFIQKSGMSLYEYLVSAYFATLHKITKEEVFPLVARVDLRVSIPQLHERIARCVNNVPLIGNFKHFETVNGFLEKMCIMIREATKYSLCPFSLIIAAAQNEELQKHMSKHEIVYDNMTNLHKTLTRNKFFLESSIFHLGYSSGTLLAIEHDTNQKYLKLVFNYGNQVVTEKDASHIMERLLYMMQTFLTHEESEIHELIGRQEKIEILAASDPLERNAIKRKDGELACGQQYLIRCDTFIEQTSHGNDEAIQLQIVKETLKSGDADIFLVWRKLDGSLVQELSVNMISEVAAKEEKDQYYIMLRTFQRWFVFKTSSRDSSVDWLHTFKDVVETVRPRQMNDLIFHL